jgi:hypothetical protein
MPKTYQVTVQVEGGEITWPVEANDEQEAKAKAIALMRVYEPSQKVKGARVEP